MAVARPGYRTAGPPHGRAAGRATRWHGEAIAGVATDMKAVTGTRALATCALAAWDAAAVRARASSTTRQSA